KDNIDDFVDIMNDIMNDISTSKLIMLKLENKYDKIIIEGEYYYYNVVTWDYKDNHKNFENDLNNSIELKNSLKNIFEYIASKNKIIINGIEIKFQNDAINDDSSDNIKIRDSLSSLESYLNDTDEIYYDLVETLELPDNEICDAFNQEMLERIADVCDGIKEISNIFNKTISGKVYDICSEIEKIISLDEIRKVADFNIKNYSDDWFREYEEDNGFDEDLTDKVLENADDIARDKSEEIYLKAKDILDNLQKQLGNLMNL
ncbi:hypothetical protein, partial [Clostridium butyricum]